MCKTEVGYIFLLRILLERPINKNSIEFVWSLTDPNKFRGKNEHTFQMIMSTSNKICDEIHCIGKLYICTI